MRTLRAAEEVALLRETACRLQVALRLGHDALALARVLPTIDARTASELGRLALALAAEQRRAKLVVGEIDPYARSGRPSVGSEW